MTVNKGWDIEPKERLEWMKVLERLGSWEKNQNADNRTVDTKAHMPAGRVEDIEQLGLVEELVRDYAADNRTVGMKVRISVDRGWGIDWVEQLVVRRERKQAVDNRTDGMKEHISADNRWDTELLERLG